MNSFDPVFSPAPVTPINIGELVFYPSSYSLKHSHEFSEIPTVSSDYIVSSIGKRVLYLTINGKIHYSEISVPVLLDEYLSSFTPFSVKIDGLVFSAMRLHSYSLSKKISDHLFDCSLIFISSASFRKELPDG